MNIMNTITLRPIFGQARTRPVLPGLSHDYVLSHKTINASHSHRQPCLDVIT